MAAWAQRVDRAVDAISRGSMVVLLDDADREDEGDLIVAATLCSTKVINFMITHARGLVCLCLTGEQCDRLELPAMVIHNRARHETAFTVSIEARDGASTGISAADRAHTIRVASSPTARPSDVVSPGHIFPLRARPGGVLERRGHTEGAIDLVRLAGLPPAGVCCEILAADGAMARGAELERFAEFHGLPLLSIADLEAFRLRASLRP